MSPTLPSWKRSFGRAVRIGSLLSATQLVVVPVEAFQAHRAFHHSFKNNVKRCQPLQPQSQQAHTLSSFAYRSSSTTMTKATSISQQDVDYMNLALEHAEKGFGSTFPNPAVGCVLVRQDTDEVVGAGFHPRAGYPHAEVFALLEAAGHVDSGVQAAAAVVAAYRPPTRRNRDDNSQSRNEDPELLATVDRLTELYADGGPQELFAPEKFLSEEGDEPFSITAYVTLEPCCHTGKTPPCAASLVASKVVSRVVVGFRDPNPRVDGGGVQLLQDSDIDVGMMASADSSDTNSQAAEEAHQGCTEIVSDFVKRITPRTEEEQTYAYITGSMRRALRGHAMRKKSDNTLSEIDWGGPSLTIDSTIEDLEPMVQALALDPTWMERVDRDLWSREIVSLRLNKAIKKKKGVKVLGERIAQQLQAHVAQTVGHTVLLYRPGMPPVLDLTTLGNTKDEDKDDDDEDYNDTQ